MWNIEMSEIKKLFVCIIDISVNNNNNDSCYNFVTIRSHRDRRTQTCDRRSWLNMSALFQYSVTIQDHTHEALNINLPILSYNVDLLSTYLSKNCPFVYLNNLFAHEALLHLTSCHLNDPSFTSYLLPMTGVVLTWIYLNIVLTFAHPLTIINMFAKLI